MRPFIACLALVACSVMAWAAESPQISVKPSFTFTDVSTELKIKSGSLVAEDQVALFDGSGPRDRGLLPGRGFAVGMDLLGSHLVVASYSYGLEILDVRDPLDPQAVGAIELDGGARAVAVDGQQFVAINDAGWLHVVDAEDPEGPELLGSTQIGSGLRDLVVRDGIAFVASSFYGLLVVDVNVASSPRLIASYHVAGTPRRLGVLGGYALIASCQAGLEIVDVRDLARPSFAGRVPAEVCTSDVLVNEERIYISDLNGALRRVDLSDPRSPRVVDAVPVGSDVSALGGKGRSVFSLGSSFAVAEEDEAGGLQVIGSAGGYWWPSSDAAIEIRDGYAFVVGTSSHVRVFDVREPAFSHAALFRAATLGTPVVLDVDGPTLCAATNRGLEVFDRGAGGELLPRIPVRLTGHARDVACAHGLAYVSDDWRGLHVFEVAGHERPRLVGRLTSPGRAEGLARDGSFVYLADGASGLQIVDVSDPADPLIVANVELPGWAFHVEHHGDYAYVSSGTELHCVRVRPAKSAALEGSIELGASASAIWAVDGLVLVARGGGDGLTVIDVQDASAPARVASIPLGYSPRDLKVAQGVAYIPFGREGLHLVDVRDPNHPRLLGSILVPLSAYAVAIDEGRVYVGSGSYIDVVPTDPLFEDLGMVAQETRRLEVPAGYAPGPYDVVLRSPEGADRVAERAFRVCTRETVEATLRPVSERQTPPSPGWMERRWELEVTHGDGLSASSPELNVGLSLPESALAAPVEFVFAEGAALASIEVWEARSAALATVRLVGADEEAARARWDELRREASLPLPPLGEGRYGVLTLSTSRRSPPGGATTFGDGQHALPASHAYRYQLVDARLAAAHAWGSDVDHRFEVTAVYDWTCEVKDTASYVETVTEMCEVYQAEHPELVLSCDF